MTQRYLKLFKADKTNRGLLYPSTGTITDTNTMQSSGNSCVYGLYFSKPENVLKYLTDKTLTIQEVFPTGTFILDTLSNDKYRTQTLNLISTEKDLSLVATWEWLKSEFTMDFTANDNVAIQYACIMGYTDVIDYLLSEGCDYTVQDYFCLYSAVQADNIVTLYHLVNTLGLPVGDVINETFVRFCMLGNVQSLNTFYQTILTKPDLTYDEYKAFRMACMSGGFEMVKRLIIDYYGLNNSAPWLAHQGYAIRYAAFTKNWDALYLTTNTDYYNPIIPVTTYRRILTQYAKEQNNTTALDWCYSL